MLSRGIKTALGLLLAVGLCLLVLSTYFSVFKVQFSAGNGKQKGCSIVIAFRPSKGAFNAGDRIVYKAPLSDAPHVTVGTILHIRRDKSTAAQVVRDSVEQDIADRIVRMDDPQDAFLVLGENPVQTHWIAAPDILGKVLKTIPKISFHKAP